MGDLAEGGVVGREEPKSLLGDLHDAVEDGGTELLALFAKGEMDDSVDFAERLAE